MRKAVHPLKEQTLRYSEAARAPLDPSGEGRLLDRTPAPSDESGEQLNELRRRLEELTTFVESASIGLHWVAPDGTILWANTAEMELLGYKRSEYIGRNICDLHADGCVIADILERLKRGERLRNYSARLKCRDGSIKHVLIDSSVYWKNGEFSHTQCYTRDVTDRRLAEEALRQSEAFNRGIVESTGDCICTLDLDGRITFINSRGRDLLGGGDGSALIERAWSEIWVDSDKDAYLAALTNARAGGTGRFEGRCRMPGGTLGIWDASVTAIRDREGNVERLLAVLREVTVQREGSERLRLYKEIFESSKDAVAIIHPDGTYLEQNEAHRNLIGYADEELRGQTPAIHLGQDCFSEIGRKLAEDGRWRGEAISRAKSGRQLVIDLSAFSVRGEDGRILCHVGIKRDVTERKQAEEALARQAREHSILYDFTNRLHRADSLIAIYDAALDAILSALSCERASILLFDAAGVMRFVRWTGLSDGYRRSVEGHSPWKQEDRDPQPICVPNVELEPLPDELKQVVLGEGIKACAFVPLVLNGSLIGKFMAYYDGLHNFSGNELSIALTVSRQLAFGIERFSASEKLERTVAERTAQLRDTVAELEAFSYSIAHDMRAPLRAMSSFARLLVTDFKDRLPEDARDYAERIESSSARLDRLIQDVLSYSRISRAELPLEAVDIEKVIQETIDSYSHLGQSGATILAEPGMPQVLGNAAALTQCVANLLSNAIKFVAPELKPQVRIWAESRHGMVRLCFADNGIGISAEGQRRLFQMFQRLNPASDFDGTGIGLTIVRKAVERMGGRVGVESEVGVGSRFWFELKPAP